MFLYKVLGVNKKSSLQEIKNAYRNLAKKYHPDLNEDEGTDVVFKTIKIAYEILSNEYTKGKYDNAIMQIDSVYAEDFLKSYEKEVKNAYLQDLSLSMEFNRKITGNLEYFIANAINSLTVNRGISPEKIEEIVRKAYTKYEQMATKEPQTTTNKNQSIGTPNVSILEESPKKNSYTGVFVFIGILALMISIVALSNNPQALAELKRREDLRQAELRREQQALEQERLKQERVAKAKNDPSLYWTFSFSSPNKDDTYFREYAVDYLDRRNKNMYCVVVGVTANKNSNSQYYLDDSYDGGGTTLYLNDFVVGNTTPESYVKYECDYVTKMFPITTKYYFHVNKGETIYLLFQIYTKIVNKEEPFKYKDKLLTNLLF